MLISTKLPGETIASSQDSQPLSAEEVNSYQLLKAAIDEVTSTERIASPSLGKFLISQPSPLTRGSIAVGNYSQSANKSCTELPLPQKELLSSIEAGAEAETQVREEKNASFHTAAALSVEVDNPSQTFINPESPIVVQVASNFMI